ncbi:DUF1330 domain-containing protein [Asaia lannensis]|uniref:DUF1330 domain-containing protein n=1 Tax=Asaia lannensis TaxID=415421 RepID=UPI001C9A18A0
MSVYIVFTKEKLIDQAEMDQYAEAAPKTLPGHSLTPIVFYGDQVCLEGEGPEGIVILEFPDREAAMNWYESDAYRAAREHRFRGATYRATLVDGVNH